VPLLQFELSPDINEMKAKKITDAEYSAGRKHLKDAAIKLFAEKGVAATSVRDIATSAGVSAGLVTHHFGSKSGLKAEVDSHMIDVFTSALKNVSRMPNAAELVNERMAATMAANASLRSYLRRSILEGDPASVKLLCKLARLIRKLCSEMRQNGLLRADIDSTWMPFQILFLHLGPLLLSPVVKRELDQDAYSPAVIRRRSAANFDLLRHGFGKTPSQKPL
jgi:AcrR family transcriptional regulator